MAEKCRFASFTLLPLSEFFFFYNLAVTVLTLLSVIILNEVLFLMVKMFDN